jgi:hypothetical protein
MGSKSCYNHPIDVTLPTASMPMGRGVWHTSSGGPTFGRLGRQKYLPAALCCLLSSVFCLPLVDFVFSFRSALLTNNLCFLSSGVRCLLCFECCLQLLSVDSCLCCLMSLRFHVCLFESVRRDWAQENVPICNKSNPFLNSADEEGVSAPAVLCSHLRSTGSEPQVPASCIGAC